MNPLRSPAFRIVLLGSILALVALHAWRRQRDLGTLERTRHDREHRLEAATRRLNEIESRLDPLRREAESAERRRSEALARAANLGGWLAASPPDRDDVHPPDILPNWNPDSPFVWLPKSVLPRLPARGFLSDGSLPPEAATVLVLDPPRLRDLNARLAGIVAQYRAAEAAHAHAVETHLPGIADQEGRKITVQADPIPEDAARLRARFESALVETLGRQRAEILSEAGRAWLDETFAAATDQPRTLSIVRRPDGTYSLATRSGGGWTSMSGPMRIEQYIPEHLRPLFAPLLDDPAPADP